MGTEHRQAKTRRYGRRTATLSAFVAGVLVILVAAAVVFSQSFIGSADEEPTSVPEAESEPTTDRLADDRDDKTYIEADVGLPRTLNPLLAESSSEKAVAALLFRGLFKTDTSGDPQVDLAQDWSVADDGLRYVVELDPDARWHDGEPVTVADVMFTLALVKDAEFPGDQGLSRFWRAITAKRLDVHRIEFELLEPYVGFPHYLTLPILPHHLLSGTLPSDLFELDLTWDAVGTGPYRLSSVDESTGELRFSAWDGAGQPELEDVVFRYFDSREGALNAFQSGAVDGMSYVPLGELEGESRLPDGSRIYAPSMSGYTALYFNVRHPQFRDVDTRRAIEYAIDREAIVDLVLGGYAIPGSSPIPKMLSAHDPGQHAPYDPERAEELLRGDGWEPDDDGLLVREGERFTVPLIVNGDDQQRMAVASVIQQQLGEVGIAIDVQALSSEEVQQALSSRQFSAALFGWHTETGDPDCFQMWHSSQAEDGLNFTGFSDPDADELLVSARRSVSVEERNQHYAAFQEIFAEQVPAVVVFYPRYHFAVSAKVEGAEPLPLVNPSDRVRQIQNWSIRDPSGD